MKISNYLHRIGLTNVKENNLETLKLLQMNHLLHVPFENLDVIHHVPIPLNIETYYKKIVTNHRGGFCYELNGLFNWLLQQLQYNCYLVAATVLRPDGSWSMERSHAAQIVELDEPYFVDVGFGDSARMPLPLTGEVKEDVSGKYRIQPIDNNINELQREESPNKWRTLLRIDMTPRKLSDFEEACHFNQTSPKSTFTQKEIMTMATKDGRYTLSDQELTITKNGEKKQSILSENEKQSILQNFFGLTF